MRTGASSRSARQRSERRRPGSRCGRYRDATRAPRAWRPENGDGVLLRAVRLVKNFPVTAGAVLQRKVGEVSAVADVSFSIRPGQTFGMVGESGCGKTTIGRLIAGLEKANGGSIVLDGEDLTAAQPA